MYELYTHSHVYNTHCNSGGHSAEIGLNMAWWRFIIIICILALVEILSGCAVYTVANTVTWVATDKSLTDHGSSKLVSADCDAVRVIQKGTYYCETRDIGVTYNRNSF